MTPDHACPDYVSLLVRAGDSTIGPGDLARLEQHAATCATCRDALAVQRQMHAVLARREPVEVRPGFARRVLGALDEQARTSWWDRLDFRQWTWRVAPVTAALTIATYVFGAGAPTRPASIETLTTTPSQVVSSALWTDEAAPEDVMSLMLFADPDASLTDALKEIAH